MTKTKETYNITNYIGRIKFGYKKTNQIASASIVMTDNNTLVATAAHCAYDWEKQQFYDQILFQSYLNKRIYKAVSAAVPKNWIELAAVEYDTCFLRMDGQFEDTFYGKGIMPIFDILPSPQYLVGGCRVLPAMNKPYTAVCESFTDTYYNSTLLGIKSKRARAMSGGPWVTSINGEYYQNSLTSLSMKKAKNMLWGPYWGEVIKRTFESGATQQNNIDVIMHSF